MYIKTLILKDFQKHKELELNLTPNLNIIVGESEAGKSCIRRAILFLFYGVVPSNYCRSGAKKTSVKAILDNGIEIERIKSTSKNAYVITINGERKEYNAIGRDIPQEVKDILGVKTLEIEGENIILNVANQIALPFLLDKSGSFRMKLFNKLTGNDLIDKVFKSLNKDILQVGRTERLEQEHLEETKKSLELTQEKLDKLEKVQQIFSEQMKSLREKSEKYEKLSEIFDEIARIKSETKDVDEKLKEIKTIPDETLIELDIKIAKLEKLNELLYDIKKNKKELLQVEEELKTIKVPEINVSELREKIEKLLTLQKIIEQIKDLEKADKKFIEDIEKVTIQIKENTELYVKLLKEAKICPTCKQKITEEDIKEIEL